MKDNVAQTLRGFVVDELLYADEMDELEIEDELLGSGLLDSLASAQLMMYAEEKFNVKFAPADLTFDNFNTLTALAALIQRRQ